MTPEEANKVLRENNFELTINYNEIIGLEAEMISATKERFSQYDLINVSEAAAIAAAKAIKELSK